MLAVISPWNGLAYWLDPAGIDNGIPEFAKTVINEYVLQYSFNKFLIILFLFC